MSLFRAPGQAFFRHAESKAPMCPSISENLARIYRIPVGSGPDYEARRKETRLPIVAMSSGRLFLDRVGRHQSLSPLYRHTQTNMHFLKRQDKGNISTLPAGGHFYFVLTMVGSGLTGTMATDRFCAVSLAASILTSSLFLAYAAQPAFDVASIKPGAVARAGGEGSRREHIDASPTGVTFYSVSLSSCIQWAYGVRSDPGFGARTGSCRIVSTSSRRTNRARQRKNSALWFRVCLPTGSTCVCTASRERCPTMP